MTFSVFLKNEKNNKLSTEFFCRASGNLIFLFGREKTTWNSVRMTVEI